MVGVDPWGSILAEPDTMNDTDVTTYHVNPIYNINTISRFDMSVDQLYNSNNSFCFDQSECTNIHFYQCNCMCCPSFPVIQNIQLHNHIMPSSNIM